MPRKVIRCKACWRGDCPDCTKWTDKTSTCQHVCDAIPKQLALPFGEDGSQGAGLQLPRSRRPPHPPAD